MTLVPRVLDAVNADRSNIVDVCKKLLPTWEEVTTENVEITAISGGVTNVLYKVSPKNSKGVSPVVVRVFGDFTEIMIDRSHEADGLVKLNKAGFGAQVLGAFQNGRIEEFLDCQTLEPSEVSKPMLMERIAKKLREFHALEIEDVNKSKLFSGIEKMLQIAKSISFDDVARQEALVLIGLEGVEKEIHEMKNICESIKSPVVYSHNDLLPGNILLLRSKDSGMISEELSPIVFIDFEYSSSSFRGYDVGNHFNEYAGLECDWSLYPNHEQKKRFCRAYLAGESEAPATVSDGSVDKLVAEADLFSLTSHLMWAVWSIIQAKYSTIDFDYLEYCNKRLGAYFDRKAVVLQAAKSIIF